MPVIPEGIYAKTPFALNGTVAPPNASNRTIVWSVGNSGTTGASIALGSNILNTVSGGVAVITATIIDGLAVGVNYTQNFTLNVLAQPLLILKMENFNLIDEGTGSGVFLNMEPIVMSKAAGNVDYFIFANEEFTNIKWHIGVIPMGTGNTLALRALTFNNGTYTLTMTFTNNGKPWLASIPFTVTD